jgi:hypothetical protein
MQALSLKVSVNPVTPPPAPNPPARTRAPAHEPLTPFLPWSAEERVPLPAEVGASPSEGSLLVELLREPTGIVDRLLDPSRLHGVVLGSLCAIVAGAGVFAQATSAALHGGSLWWGRPVLLMSLNVLMALAASLGPIYAASLLVAARVPLARLVGALLAATATGSLLVGALAPPLYVLWRLDNEWAGPLMLLATFVLAGFVAGARIHRLLQTMALAVTRAALGDPAATLSAGDAFRVGIVARIAWMLLAFTLACGFWALDALR